jgi:predicted nuclease with RNAse H fold
VRTTGIDVASQDARTAICSIVWEGGTARIEPIEGPGASDEQIRHSIEISDRVGVDIPLGWPAAFVEAVSRHHRGEAWIAPTDRDGMAALRLRETDRWITANARRSTEPHAQCRPMSVSTNLIAIPAMRMARVLGPTERNGNDVVIEVYPAAALFVWDLPYRGYKGAGVERRAVRHELVGALRAKTPRLSASEADWAVIRENDHVLDALIASLVARAKSCGLCKESEESQSDNARSEGWIALPLPDALPRLTQFVGLRPK